MHGDCLERLKELPDASVDAICTDPPAGINFMQADWDKDKGGRVEWVKWMTDVAKECIRLIKPGGHAIVWAIPRTSHWTAMAWEDAGWDCRDVITHIFGSGMPKSLSVDRAIDDELGVERTVVGERVMVQGGGSSLQFRVGERREVISKVTVATSEEARRWDGWGTNLKPASEHWILLRKPFEGTVAQNVILHGTGAINLKGCRVEAEDGYRAGADPSLFEPAKVPVLSEGRWPANLLHDGSSAALSVLEATPREAASGKPLKRKSKLDEQGRPHAARFFYCTKIKRKDREEGLEEGGIINTHPTVKNTELMRFLVRLIGPPEGIVLDPFMGSGSTGKACAEEGLQFLGIEREKEFFDISEARINHAYLKAALPSGKLWED